VAWLAPSPLPRDIDSDLDGLLASAPVVGGEWRRYADLVLDQAPPELAELLRLRLAQLHECDPGASRSLAELPRDQLEALDDWEHSPVFSPVQREALAIADKWPWRVHDVTDDELAALSTELGVKDAVALVTALSLFDVHFRLQVMFELDDPREELDVD
jgi:alkylhydroperoxidase family enzyme